MVDLHMHILPGLDDGASSMEESIRMARQAAAGGSAADSGKNFPIYGDFYERKGNATDPGSGASFY